MSSAIYARVSTEEQNLDRQLNSAQEYAETDLSMPLSDLEVSATSQPAPIHRGLVIGT